MLLSCYTGLLPHKYFPEQVNISKVFIVFDSCILLLLRTHLKLLISELLSCSSGATQCFYFSAGGSDTATYSTIHKKGSFIFFPVALQGTQRVYFPPILLFKMDYKNALVNNWTLTTMTKITRCPYSWCENMSPSPLALHKEAVGQHWFGF